MMTEQLKPHNAATPPPKILPAAVQPPKSPTIDPVFAFVPQALHLFYRERQAR